MESGFSIADVDKTGHPTTFWDYMRHIPEGKPEGFRAKRFAEAMQTAAMALATNFDDVVKLGFNWDALGQATVVDVRLSELSIMPPCRYRRALHTTMLTVLSLSDWRLQWP